MSGTRSKRNHEAPSDGRLHERETSPLGSRGGGRERGESSRSADGGVPLSMPLRAHFEPAFHFDFGSVRVHSDAESERTAADSGAAAITVGSEILFGAGEFVPESPRTQLLLAHELAHVVQNARAPEARNLAPLTAPNDSAEREASEASHRAVRGEAVSIGQAPTAIASTGLVGWLEDNVVDPAAGAISDAGSYVADKASDVGSFVGDQASAAWNATSSAASSVGSAVQSGAGTAWGGIKDAGSYVYDGMKQNAAYVKEGVKYADKGIDWLEGQASAGAHSLADHAKGIPVLEQLAQGGAWAVDQQAQLTGGVLKGATTLLGGVGQMVADPVDTVRGLEAMAEHVRIVPGMPNPLQVAHGLYNAATSDATLAGEMNRTLNPLEQVKGDQQFGQALVGGLLEPYKESWDKGKYAEVGGRAIFDIGSLFIGAGEANAGLKGAEGAALASDAVRGTEVANVVADASRGAEGANAVADVVRGADRSSGALDATRGAAEAEGMQSALKGTGGATGAGYVDEATPKAIKAYQEIAAMEGDAASIAKQLGIDEDIVRQVKNHLFHDEHAVPVPDYAAKTVEVRTGKFAPDAGIADLWKKAQSGTLSAEEAAEFRKLMGHEYVESGLMKEGVPYTDPKAFREGDLGYYSYPSAEAHGAHDLAPGFGSDPFSHWKSIFGEGVQTPAMKPDLSNLPDVLAFIRKMKGLAP